MADKNIEKKTTTTTNNTAFKPLSDEELAMVTGGLSKEELAAEHEEKRKPDGKWNAVN